MLHYLIEIFIDHHNHWYKNGYVKPKNLHISIIRNACGYSYDICKADNGTHIADGIFKGPNDGGQWDTYEEALEVGIQEAIKLI